MYSQHNRDREVWLGNVNQIISLLYINLNLAHATEFPFPNLRVKIPNHSIKHVIERATNALNNL